MQIDKLEQDSKKLKRHRIIADLNQKHPNFIERIKDETDKRRNLYKINVKS
jgi:DNA-binding MarR family transcriptional regulator